MAGLDDIIAGIRSSYDRSNIQDIELEELMEERPEIKVGYLLQNMEPESAKMYAINFDPVETLFLDKLINQEVLDKRVIMTKKDFFKGIVFLDYLTTIVLDDTRILDDLYEIALDLETKQEDLDPDLGLVVRYSAMDYLSHSGRRALRDDEERTLERYNEKNKSYEPAYSIIRKISPIYESLGAMVYDISQDETIRSKIPDMLCLYDIKASIFIDSILDVIEDEGSREQVIGAFSEGDYYRSSMLAMDLLSGEVTRQTFNTYINRMMGNQDVQAVRQGYGDRR